MTNMNIDPSDPNPDDPLHIEHASFQYGVSQVKKTLADNLLEGSSNDAGAYPGYP